MALNLNNGNGLPRVDIESLLWEMRDILRGLSQVSKAQSAEIERLSGKPVVQTAVAAEYDERAVSAIRAVDAALDQLDAGSLDAAETHYDSVDVAAWIQATNDTLYGAVAFASEPTVQSTSEVPHDFWDVDEFKWEDEPEVEVLPSSSFEQWQDDSAEIATVYDADDDLSPSDSITERGHDDSDDEQESEPHSDSDTLLDAEVMRAVERHAYVTGQRKNSLDTLCDEVVKCFSAPAKNIGPTQLHPHLDQPLRDNLIAVV